MILPFPEVPCRTGGDGENVGAVSLKSITFLNPTPAQTRYRQRLPILNHPALYLR